MIKQKPEWLKIKLRVDGKFGETAAAIKKNALHTVCEEALCPNRSE